MVIPFRVGIVQRWISIIVLNVVGDFHLLNFRPIGHFSHKYGSVVYFPFLPDTFTSHQMPRLASGQDYHITPSVSRLSLSDTTHGLDVPAITTDVHSLVYTPEPAILLNNFRSSVTRLFQAMNDGERMQFYEWLSKNRFIERGTLSRCGEFSRLFYELEKRQLLHVFQDYNDYPDNLDHDSMRWIFRQIPRKLCDVCKKKLLTTP